MTKQQTRTQPAAKKAAHSIKKVEKTEKIEIDYAGNHFKALVGDHAEYMKTLEEHIQKETFYQCPELGSFLKHRVLTRGVASMRPLGKANKANPVAIRKYVDAIRSFLPAYDRDLDHVHKTPVYIVENPFFFDEKLDSDVLALKKLAVEGYFTLEALRSLDHSIKHPGPYTDSYIQEHPLGRRFTADERDAMAHMLEFDVLPRTFRSLHELGVRPFFVDTVEELNQDVAYVLSYPFFENRRTMREWKTPCFVSDLFPYKRFLVNWIWFIDNYRSWHAAK
jgi:hypothetical protein